MCEEMREDLTKNSKYSSFHQNGAGQKQFLGLGETYDFYCKTTFNRDCCNDFGTSRALITNGFALIV